SLLGPTPFAEGLTCAEDWAFFLDVAEQTEWHYLDQRLAFLRVHAGNNTKVNPTNGLMTAKMLAGRWAELPRGPRTHRPLASYGRSYRWHAQQAVWSAARQRQIPLTVDTYRAWAQVMPRRTDRLYSLMPPSLT